ncbi:MAG: type III-B CRISPR module-associated protein Cmr5 [Chloroflexi bacterium]|nr:type III-B CRISPR module-associated protein Cmr5 [Chloroflexota bacterium]
MPTHQQTLEQQRAHAAWQAIKEVRTNEQKKYSAIARTAPSYILTNGLGQTLAFLSAKSDAEKTLYRHLESWLKTRLKIADAQFDAREWIGRTDSAMYRRAMVETLAYLTWLKRFAEAEFGVEEE